MSSGQTLLASGSFRPIAVIPARRNGRRGNEEPVPYIAAEQTPHEFGIDSTSPTRQAALRPCVTPETTDGLAPTRRAAPAPRRPPASPVSARSLREQERGCR